MRFSAARPYAPLPVPTYLDDDGTSRRRFIRKNWYREIRGKTRNRLTHKLPPIDSQRLATGFEHRHTMVDENLALRSRAFPTGDSVTRFWRICWWVDGWFGKEKTRDRPRRYSRNDSPKFVLRPRNLKLRTSERRMMNDETKKENAVEQRPGVR